MGLYGIHFPTDRFHLQSGMILDTRTLLPVAAIAAVTGTLVAASAARARQLSRL